MKNFILIVLMAIIPFFQPVLLHASVHSSGQSDTVVYTPAVDSLLHRIKTSSGIEMLKQYPRLHKALYEVDDVDIHLRFNREFAEAAKAAGDKKMEAIAAVLKVEAMYNYRVADSILLSESLKALDLIKDVPGAEVHYFYTASVIGDIYMLQGNYEEALKAAGMFYEEAKKMKNNSGMVASLQSMGKAYQELEMPDKAEASFRESIAIADEKKEHGMKGEGYSYLVDMLNGQKRYEDALQVNKEFELYLERIDAYNGELKNLCFLNYLGYAASYTCLGQYKQAWEYIAKAEGFAVARTSLGMYSVEKERSALLIEEGRYVEAEESLNRIESTLGNDASYYKAASELKEMRADLYFRWGKFDKAASAYKELIIRKDSLQRVEMATKLNTLRTQYEVDKLEMQKEQQRHTFRNTLLWLSVALVLLCAIIVLVALNARRLRAKNRALLERIRGQERMEQESDRVRAELARHDAASEGAADEEMACEGNLYFRLKELMKDPAVFTDPDASRKSIAQKLHTNEKYVFDTVRKYYGMSISEYVYSLRLNYARELLSLPPEEYTVERVATEAGFKNRVTFHRMFKERHGMTPNEFRRLVTTS